MKKWNVFAIVMSFLCINNSTFSMDFQLDSQLRTIVLENAPGEVKNVLKEIDNSTRKNGVILLLYGPTGTGKTTLAQAIADAKGYKCLLVKSTQTESILQSSGKLNVDYLVQAIVNSGKKRVIVFDEIDNLIPQNACNDDVDTGGIKAFSQIVDQLENNPNVVIIGTTNYINRLPETSTNRMTHIVEVPRPHKDYRKNIINFYLKELKNQCTPRVFQEHILSYLAKQSKGFTIRNLKRIGEKGLWLAKLRFEKEKKETKNSWYAFWGWKRAPESKLLVEDLYASLKQIKKRPDVKKELEKIKKESTTQKLKKGILSFFPSSQVVGHSLTLGGMGLSAYIFHKQMLKSEEQQRQSQRFAEEQQRQSQRFAEEQQQQSQELTKKQNEKNTTQSLWQTGFSIGFGVVTSIAIAVIGGKNKNDKNT